MVRAKTNRPPQPSPELEFLDRFEVDFLGRLAPACLAQYRSPGLAGRPQFVPPPPLIVDR